MRVKDCERLCDKHQRRTWSHKHYSAHYHAVGMTHAYAYCLKHQKRCREVKSCDALINKGGQ